MQRSLSFSRSFISATFLGALFLFGAFFSPSTALATCFPEGGGPGLEPVAWDIGNVSLDASQTTISTTDAHWRPGVACESGAPYPISQGEVRLEVDGTVLVSPWITRMTTGLPPGGYYNDLSLDVSSLSNGTYTLVFRVQSTYGDPNWDELTTTFTINNRGASTSRLNVTKSGTGTGTVTAPVGTNNGISCGSNCTEDYANGTSVTMTPTPAAGSTFAGWTGSADCSNGNVTMNSTRNCNAIFNTTGGTTYTLNIVKAGTGGGTVTAAVGTGDGISCGSNCSEGYASGASVAMTATPVSGSTFGGWTGTGCTTGTVSMTANRTCTATFNSSTPAPTATISANPQSVVAGNTTTITWGSTNATNCYANAEGQAVGFYTGTNPSGTDQTGTLQVASSPIDFAVHCVGAGGEAWATTTVTVNAAVTATLSASPSPVPYGAMTTLTWGSTGATSCVVTQGAGAGFATNGATSGSDQSVQVWTSPVNFGISCTGPGGTATASTTVKLKPECTPAGQTATTGQAVSLSARGGNPVPGAAYSWSAPGGVPSTSTSNPLSVTYSTSGVKSITVSSDGMTSTACTVTVSDAPPTTGTIVVNSNLPTTWWLDGPPGTSEHEISNQTSKTYTNKPAGLYTLSNVPTKAGYLAPVITPGVSQNLGAGLTITFTITYNPEPPAPGGSVDIRANGENGPVYVSSANPMAYLTWTSSDIEPGTCVGVTDPKPTSWDGNKDDEGAEWSATIEEATTFTITCDEAGGGGAEEEGGGFSGAGGNTVSDSVIVDLRPPQCSDGEDNDDDKAVDFPTDPGCQSADDDDEANVTQCSDGIDNNDPEDELADYPTDPGCSAPTDDDELNQATTVTQCNNGLDDDGDELIDYDGGDQTDPDPGCEGALDPSETDDPDIREI